MAVILALLVIVLIANGWIAYKMLQEQRECRRQLKLIASLTRDSRSHQGSIGTRRSNGTAPVMEKALQRGPRYDVPGTGRMKVGLRFERKGGEYERNRDGD